MAWQDRGALPMPKATGQANKSNFAADLLPTAGGIGGSLGGAALGASIGSIIPGIGTVIGGLAGGIIGGSLGSGGGQVAKNAATGEKDLGKGVAQEALLGGIFSAPPIRLARGVGAAAKVATGVGKTVASQTAKGAFEQAFIGGAKKAARGGVESTAQRLIGQGTGIRAGVSIKGTPLTPQKMKTLQDFTLKTIGVPKNANAEGVFERAVNYSDETGSAIGSVIRSLPKNKVNVPTVTKTINQKINGIIGVDAANNQVAKDVSARLASAKTPEELWTLKRELDRNLINYGRNPQSTVPGAEEVARAASQELGKVLSNAAPDLKILNRNYSNTQDIIALAAGATKNPQGFKLPGFQQTVGGATAQSIKTGAGNALQAGQATVGKLPSMSSRVGEAAGGQYAKPSPLLQAGGQFAFGAQNSQPSLDQALMQQSDTGQLMQTNPDGSYKAAPFGSASDTFMSNDPSALTPPQEQNPYPRENLLYDMQRDPDNADEYLAYYQQVQEVFAPAASEKPLSAEASKVISNANSGLQSLGELESVIQAEGGVPKATLIPGRELFGNAGANALGTAGFDNASKNLADVITRLRTGAALTESEESFYKSQLPQAFDSPDVINQKLRVFRDLFESVASRTGSAGTSLEEALMSQQGGF